MRLAFAGTPEFAAHILEGLIASSHAVIGVLTQPQRPAGRGRRPHASVVQRVADRSRLDVLTPEKLPDPRVLRQLTAWAPDALVVAAYGLILPSEILQVPVHGCINVHASLLPRWRGAAPIEHAIMAGDHDTGVSIMQMNTGLDTGPVYRTATCHVEPDDTGDSLSQKLARLGLACLLQTLADMEAGNARSTAQDARRATYAPKLAAEDAIIQWDRDASAISLQVRALFSRMPAVTSIAGTRVRVLKADLVDACGDAGTLIAADDHGITVACGQGALCIHELQLARGKGRPMSARDARNGYPDLFHPGARFDARP